MDHAHHRTFTFDPVLQHQPPFARSLPVQLLLTGVVLTLTAVLFIHLAFTAQYHWPLAPVNYALQLSGVALLLVSLGASVHIILATAFADSQTWPYMLTYIAIDVPPSGTNDDDASWAMAELAAWYTMEAVTSGLIHVSAPASLPASLLTSTLHQ